MGANVRNGAAKTVIRIDVAKDFWRPGSSLGPILWLASPIIGAIGSCLENSVSRRCVSPRPLRLWYSALGFSVLFYAITIIWFLKRQAWLDVGGKGRGAAGPTFCQEQALMDERGKSVSTSALQVPSFLSTSPCFLARY